MASFHSAMFPHCLALHSEEGFSIGTVDDIQRVHVRTVPLGESPRRITYNSQAGVYAGEFNGPHKHDCILGVD